MAQKGGGSGPPGPPPPRIRYWRGVANWERTLLEGVQSVQCDSLWVVTIVLYMVVTIHLSARAVAVDVVICHGPCSWLERQVGGALACYVLGVPGSIPGRVATIYSLIFLPNLIFIVLLEYYS